LKYHYILLLPLIFLFSQCSGLVEKMEGEEYEKEFEIRDGVSEFSMVFSGNVNGETHPCGCRNFPLGGIPQVAGALKKIEKKHPVLFVDAGDTFFPSATVPESMKDSHLFIARKIHDFYNKMGLKYMVFGDQDLAYGFNFLEELSKTASYTFLVSNLKPGTKIKYKRWVKIKVGSKYLFLTGVIDPATIRSHLKNHFTNPLAGLKNVYKEIQKAGFVSKRDHFVVISHSGMNTDLNLSAKLPQIDWFVGAHSQSFNNYPKTSGKTNLVQVLSRNHYLGQITIPLGKKRKGKYAQIQVRDELKDQLKPNPYIAEMDIFKQKLSKIQLTEQNKMGQFQTEFDYPTATSCVECHQEQTKFWGSTAHSLAYHTLMRVKELNNPKCLKCHTLGYRMKTGFSKTQDLIHFSEQNALKKSKVASLKKAYFRALYRSLGELGALRQTSGFQITKHKKVWDKIDEKYKVDENFANVQCAHCHRKTSAHPFDSGDGPPKMAKSKKIHKMKTNCVKCHTKDQSPEWYEKNSKGLPGKLGQAQFLSKLREVACPKRTESGN